jgi:hypothetical protein
MASTTQFDVLPHLRRALAYRFLREHRRLELSKQAKGWTEKPIIFEIDVAPHLRRAMAYRTLRRLRRRELHSHIGRARIWRIMVVLLLLFWAAVIYGLKSAFD